MEVKSNSATFSRLALWSTGTTPFNANAGLPQLPFIVAAAREYLNTSKWSSCTSTVPGEADSYCASAAAATADSPQPAVLTNDSDLVLFEDMQANGTIILLNSLVKSDGQSGFGCIRGSCWRPAEIKRQLSLTNLLHLGFERMKDPSCSFLSLMQSVKASSHVAVSSAEEFIKFAEQYQSEGSSCEPGTDIVGRNDHPRMLDMLDPRLAELVVQLERISSHNAHVQGDIAFNMYFPILHEDPNRDSSWSYGRRYRQLGYAILYHCQHSSAHMSQPPRPRSGNVFISEFTRKGHAISQENLRVHSYHDLIDILKKHHEELNALSSSVIVNDSSCTTDVVRQYVLFALTHILQQRSSNGKKPPPPRLLAQFLGLSPFLTHRSGSTRHHATTPTTTNDNDMWTLLHLNANVQAVLYSLRILKQCIDYYHRHLAVSSSHGQESDGESRRQVRSDMSKANKLSNHGLNLVENEGRDICDLRSLLADMPNIATLFLSSMELAAHFRKLPLSSGNEMCESGWLKEFFENTGVDLTAFSHSAAANKKIGDCDEVVVVDDDHDNSDGQFREQTRRQKNNKKRKKERSNWDILSKTTSRVGLATRNMFDVLEEEA